MPITVNELKSIYEEIFAIFEKRQIPAADMLIHLQGFVTHTCYIANGGNPNYIEITKSVLDDHFSELTKDLIERKKMDSSHAKSNSKRQIDLVGMQRVTPLFSDFSPDENDRRSHSG